MADDNDIKLAFFREHMEAAAEQARKLAEHVNDYFSKESEGNEDSLPISSTSSIRPLDTFFGRDLFPPSMLDMSLSDISTCEHISVYNPTVMVVLLFSLKDFYCIPCALKVQKSHNAHNPDTCDFCGEVTDSFSEVTMPIASVILLGNVCDTCITKQRESMGL